MIEHASECSRVRLARPRKIRIAGERAKGPRRDWLEAVLAFAWAAVCAASTVPNAIEGPPENAAICAAFAVGLVIYGRWNWRRRP
jgi:hypothetical protein